MENQVIKFVPPSIATESCPDTERYKGGFLVRSETSNRKYKISFDMAVLCFKCSCPGCIRFGQCKHLTAAGLKGRNYGKQLDVAKKYGWLT